MKRIWQQASGLSLIHDLKKLNEITSILFFSDLKGIYGPVVPRHAPQSTSSPGSFWTRYALHLVNTELREATQVAAVEWYVTNPGYVQILVSRGSYLTFSLSSVTTQHVSVNLAISRLYTGTPA